MSANTERALRRSLSRDGYILRKSRVRTPTIDNLGDYMVINASSNLAVLGQRWDASLDDVEGWMRA